MPLGELDPSKIKCVMTSALGRPRFPESFIICWCREPNPSRSDEDDEFKVSGVMHVMLSGVANTLEDVDVAVNACVVFSS